MNYNSIATLAFSTALVITSSNFADAQSYNYQQTVFPTNNAAYGPTEGYSQLGGKIRDINTTYDKTNQVLSWSATLDTHYKSSSTDPRLSNSFFLVLSNGPDPKATLNDEYVIALFDGTNAASPEVTFYSYNGGGIASFSPGLSNVYLGGTKAPGGSPHATTASLSTSSIGTDSNGRPIERSVFNLSIDTSLLNDDTWVGSQFANAGASFDPNNWYGTGFGDGAAPDDGNIGLWFHPSQLDSVSYAANGQITGVTKTSPGDKNGYLDLTSRSITAIPEPSSSLMVGLSLVLLTIRRKR